MSFSAPEAPPPPAAAPQAPAPPPMYGQRPQGSKPKKKPATPSMLGTAEQSNIGTKPQASLMGQ